MEKENKYVENYAITLTLKQATGYIISLVLAAGSIVGIYFKNGAKIDLLNERISLMDIRLKTNEATIDAGKNDRVALKLALTALETKMDVLKK